jgi:hypothetical protein
MQAFKHPRLVTSTSTHGQATPLRGWRSLWEVALPDRVWNDLFNFCSRLPLVQDARIFATRVPVGEVDC